MTQIVEIWSALFFVIIMVQIITKYDIMRNKQIRIEISYILNNLITVIFCYQISLKSLKTLSLSQVSFQFLFPFYYFVPFLFTKSYTAKKNVNKIK